MLCLSSVAKHRREVRTEHTEHTEDTEKATFVLFRANQTQHIPWVHGVNAGLFSTPKALRQLWRAQGRNSVGVEGGDRLTSQGSASTRNPGLCYGTPLEFTNRSAVPAVRGIKFIIRAGWIGLYI
jgi:hypothetical protein